MEERGISVVVSTYDDPMNFVRQCVDSILPQKNVGEIIIVDSSKKDEIRTFCKYLGNDKINYVHVPPRGLSDARNKGVEIAKNDIVAFTDSDCIIDENWAYNICISFGLFNNSFTDSLVYSPTKDVAIVGGKVLPKWLSKPNKILLNSVIAQGFYSLFDMGEELKEVEQIFGGNFAIDKNLITGKLFSTDVGRKKGNLLGGEESMLCMHTRDIGLKIIYNPKIVVWHQIPEERSKSSWMWKRLYYGGINRASVGGKPTPRVVNSPYNICDAVFLMIFITPYIYGFIKTRLEKGDMCVEKY